MIFVFSFRNFIVELSKTRQNFSGSALFVVAMKLFFLLISFIVSTHVLDKQIDNMFQEEGMSDCMARLAG